MTWHVETWQRALDLALLIAISLGFGAIVVAVRGSRRAPLSREQRTRLGVLGAVVFLVFTAARLLLSDTLAPIARPGAAPTSSGAAPTPSEIVTDRTFESAALPAMRIDAPDGFRVSFDGATRRVSVTDAGGQTLVLVFTRVLDDGGSAAGVRAELRRQLEASGVAAVDFDDTIAGASAVGIAAKVEGASNASWCVDRPGPAGKPMVTVVQCRAPADREARAACAPVLERLRWVVPR